MPADAVRVTREELYATLVQLEIVGPSAPTRHLVSLEWQPHLQSRSPGKSCSASTPSKSSSPQKESA